MEAMEEDEWLKSNTDCVYFLASPLTCKKGIECEYRHSEIARLKPRDCWYWLAGNCLNPFCGFRHPPLDGPTDGSLESAIAYHEPATSLQKTNVPCHFFFNGFCNKGERCSFMHGPSDNANLKPQKTKVSAVEEPTSEKKIAMGSDRGPDLPKLMNISSVKVSQSRAKIDIKPEVENHQSAADYVVKQTANLQHPDFLFEEAVTGRSYSPLPAAEFMHGTSLVTDQSSADQVQSHTEVDDRLDSSPGFDVLIDNSSEELGYENDFQNEVGEGNDCSNQHVLYHHYGDMVLYPTDSSGWYDHEDYRTCYHSDSENHFVLPAKEFSNHARDEGLRCHFLRKRKFLPDSGFRDLRELLKKRTLMIHGCYQDRFLRRNRMSQRYRNQQSVMQQSRGRLASKVVGNGRGSGIDNGIFLSRANQQGRLRHSSLSRSRKRVKERRQNKQQQQLKSVVYGKAASRRECLVEEPRIFEGPKSLAQIREEKRKQQDIM